MKVFSTLALAAAAVLALGLVAVAADKDKDKDEPKAVTLMGTLTCPHCDKSVKVDPRPDACANVLVVKDKDSGKDVVYWLKDGGKGESYHACQAAVEATVKGTVSTDKDGKKILTPDKDGVTVKK
jgi:hypothetical protein